MEMLEHNDVELVGRTQEGDRAAFAAIVERYQSLITSVAYSGTGSLAQSEEIAQETFLEAWRRLGTLREPERLGGWLCAIARHRAADRRRREGVEKKYAASVRAAGIAAVESPPERDVISREEQALLWRALEAIPQTYREPLILFYREEQSVERVAEALQVSEDAVKQRLSRGRRMLQESLVGFVEDTLRRTKPSTVLALAIVAALPVGASTAKAATVGTVVAKGAGSAAGVGAWAGWGLLGAVAGPVMGLMGAYLGVRASLDAARTPRQRALVMRNVKISLVMMVVFNLVIFSQVLLAVRYWHTHAVLLAVSGIVLMTGMAVAIVVQAAGFNRAYRKLALEEAAIAPPGQDASGVQAPLYKEYKSARTLLGLPLVHIHNGWSPDEGSDRVKAAVGWVAIGSRAYGVLFAGGGVACSGGIAMGGAAVAPLAVGGVTVGLIAVGGFAVGAVALGGAAIGILASGGFAMAWQGAMGGLAVAHEFARGGLALAAHANDEAAAHFFARFPYLDPQNAANRNGIAVLIWFPLLAFFLLFRIVQRRARRQSSHARS